MSKKVLYAVVFAVAVFAAGTVLAIDIKEGKWEHTIEVKMEGIPVKIPSMPVTVAQPVTEGHRSPNRTEGSEL